MNKSHRSHKTYFAVALIALAALFAPAIAPAADLTQTAANVVASVNATKVVGVAGATITAGQLVYEDTTDGKLKLADANGASPLFAALGMALHGASDNQPLIVVTADPSLDIGATVANGDVLIVSGTPGRIAPAADAATGWNVSFVGVGNGSNKINFRIVRSDVAK